MHHFSIPDSVEFVHPASPRNSFTGFNIHVNGSFHACLRYKQLHSLHEQLKQTFHNIQLPPFPSKKLFLLSPGQLEERRASLERYIQLIGQDPIFSRSELLRSFLLAAQQESAAVESNVEVTFDVYLTNGHRIPVKCLATDPSSKLLELVCDAVSLPRELTYYFALFLLRKDPSGEVVIQRKLMDFEAPYITHSNSGPDFKCVLRKCYWDAAYDLELMRDPVGLNLLYLQTVSDGERASATDAQTMEELASLQARGNKKEYLEIARKLPNYGTVRFSEALVDYPEESQATVIIGNKEITFQTATGDPNTIQETKFRVTRIRCWKITTIHNPGDEDGRTLELSFEFLMSKNYLKWIQVRSEKAMMMTVCLQSMVAELLNQKSENYKSSNVTKPNARISFVMRDDTNQFRLCDGVTRAVTTESSGSAEESSRRPPPARNTEFVKQKLKEISTTVFFKNGQNRVHNEAFEGIGDEDL